MNSAVVRDQDGFVVPKPPPKIRLLSRSKAPSWTFIKPGLIPGATLDLCVPPPISMAGFPLPAVFCHWVDKGAVRRAAAAADTRKVVIDMQGKGGANASPLIRLSNGSGTLAMSFGGDAALVSRISDDVIALVQEKTKRERAKMLDAKYVELHSKYFGSPSEAKSSSNIPEGPVTPQAAVEMVVSSVIKKSTQKQKEGPPESIPRKKKTDKKTKAAKAPKGSKDSQKKAKGATPIADGPLRKEEVKEGPEESNLEMSSGTDKDQDGFASPAGPPSKIIKKSRIPKGGFVKAGLRKSKKDTNLTLGPDVRPSTPKNAEEAPTATGGAFGLMGFEELLNQAEKGSNVGDPPKVDDKPAKKSVDKNQKEKELQGAKGLKKKSQKEGKKAKALDDKQETPAGAFGVMGHEDILKPADEGTNLESQEEAQETPIPAVGLMGFEELLNQAEKGSNEGDLEKVDDKRPKNSMDKDRKGKLEGAEGLKKKNQKDGQKDKALEEKTDAGRVKKPERQKETEQVKKLGSKLQLDSQQAKKSDDKAQKEELQQTKSKKLEDQPQKKAQQDKKSEGVPQKEAQQTKSKKLEANPKQAKEKEENDEYIKRIKELKAKTEENRRLQKLGLDQQKEDARRKELEKEKKLAERLQKLKEEAQKEKPVSEELLKRRRENEASWITRKEIERREDAQRLKEEQEREREAHRLMELEAQARTRRQAKELEEEEKKEAKRIKFKKGKLNEEPKKETKRLKKDQLEGEQEGRSEASAGAGVSFPRSRIAADDDDIELDLFADGDIEEFL